MPIVTPSIGLRAATVRVDSGTGSFEAYLVQPEAAERAPGVVVIHEIVGLNDYIRDVARRLGQAGFVALAPDLFHGIPGIDSNNVIATREALASVPDRRFVEDLAAARAHLGSLAAFSGKAAVIGFCMGGFYSLVAGEQVEGWDAVVAYYGPIKVKTSELKPYHPLAQAHLMKAPLLCIYGEADHGIPVQDAHELASKLKGLGNSVELVTYPGAPHAFHCDIRPDRYTEHAAEQAWQRTIAFLNQTLL